MPELFHQHTLIKAEISNPPRSEESLNAWLKRLVKAIDMQVCIEPRSFYVDTPGNEGLTGQIGLMTSHIAAHFWDERSPCMVQMDVYSCKGFQSTTLIRMLDEFKLGNYELMTIDRNRDFQVVEHTVVEL